MRCTYSLGLNSDGFGERSRRKCHSATELELDIMQKGGSWLVAETTDSVGSSI